MRLLMRLLKNRKPRRATVSEETLLGILEERGAAGFRILPSMERPLTKYHRSKGHSGS